MAKGPGGKSVGRVSIRVVPDTTRFKADLKKSLDRIEKSTVLKLSVGFDTRGADLELRRAMKRWQGEGQRSPVTLPAEIGDLDKTWQTRLKSQVAAATKKIEATIPAGVDGERMRADLQAKIDEINRTLKIQIPTDPEKAADFRSKLKSMVDEINDKTGEVDVDLKTTGALAHLREFLRRRSLNVDVDLTKTSLAKAATTLASLSGARLTGDLVRNITRSLGDLDRSLPKIAALVMAIGSIGAVALSSVGGLLTLVASLTALVALAAPLPGILGGAAVGAVVFGVALSSASDQLASLAPVWTRLKTVITDNFWSKAKQPIIDFVEATLPQLRSGLASVSSGLGSWAASIAAGFQRAFGGGVLEGMLEKLRESIDIASTGTGGFASAIATLGTFGSQYLPRLAQWFADITNSFDAWVSKVASDGNLAQWVEQGIAALKSLGSVISSTIGIFSGLQGAALNAGGGGIASLAGVMKEIAATVNSQGFQETLTTLFVGATLGAQALAVALGPIGSLLSGLAPVLASSMQQIGQTVGTVLSSIANALSSPAVSSGIVNLVSGLQAGLMAIMPSLPAVANALGSVATFAGQLAAQLGPVLGAALQVVAPLLSQILAALTPLIPVLGQAFLSVLSAVAPVATQLVTALTPLITMLAGQIGPLISSVVAALAPALAVLVPVISSLVPIVSTLVQAFVPLVEGILPILTTLITAVSPIIQLLAGIFAQVAEALLPIITAIMPPLNELFAALMPIIMTVVSAVMQLLQPILDLISPLLQLIGPILAPLIQLLTVLANFVAGTVVKAFGALTPVFSGIVSMITGILLPVIKTITDVLGGVITFLTGVFTGNWKQAWDGIVQIFSGIWNGIIGIGKGALNGVVDVINGLIGGVNNITGAIGIPAIPKIPKLAIGADIEPTLGGTAVILGEGGRKETVTDYGRTNALIEAANALALRSLSVGAGTGPGTTINVTEVSDPIGTAMAVIRRIEALGA